MIIYHQSLYYIWYTIYLIKNLTYSVVLLNLVDNVDADLIYFVKKGEKLGRTSTPQKFY